MFENQFLMNEFGGMEDWGLQAVVQGLGTTVTNSPQSCFVPLGSLQQDDLFSFPDLFETTAVLDELEQLYKPLYPVLHPLNSPQTILTTSISVPRDVKESQKLPLPESAVAAAAAAAAAAATGPPPLAVQSKKSFRRNQQKKMVLQVTADGLSSSSDMWAWRKYGQKPIKGSPYPRSYYRCSSSKGCLARKQVERSSSDPGTFIITYTAEHSHTHPTRRSSLTGGMRNKSSSRKRPTTDKTDTPTVKDSCCSPTTVLSPTTPSIASIEDEFLQHATKQESPEKEEEQQIIDGKDNEVVIANMISNSELVFPSLEELDRLTSNMTFDHWFYDQIPAAFPC